MRLEVTVDNTSSLSTDHAIEILCDLAMDVSLYEEFRTFDDVNQYFIDMLTDMVDDDYCTKTEMSEIIIWLNNYERNERMN